MCDETVAIEGHMPYLFRSEHNVIFHLRKSQVFWKVRRYRWATSPCCAKERNVFIVHYLSLKVKAISTLKFCEKLAQ